MPLICRRHAECGRGSWRLDETPSLVTPRSSSSKLCANEGANTCGELWWSSGGHQLHGSVRLRTARLSQLFGKSKQVLGPSQPAAQAAPAVRLRQTAQGPRRDLVPHHARATARDPPDPQRQGDRRRRVAKVAREQSVSDRHHVLALETAIASKAQAHDFGDSPRVSSRWPPGVPRSPPVPARPQAAHATGSHAAPSARGRSSLFNADVQLCGGFDVDERIEEIDLAFAEFQGVKAPKDDDGGSIPRRPSFCPLLPVLPPGAAPPGPTPRGPAAHESHVQRSPATHGRCIRDHPV